MIKYNVLDNSCASQAIVVPKHLLMENASCEVKNLALLQAGLDLLFNKIRLI
jgi:hypothetical protein